jgi:DNA-binding beta-propeller fold protein YncE
MNKRNFFILSLVLICCSDNQDSQGGGKNPDGYDLARPQKFMMPESLVEISGICFRNGNSDTIYAEQDEEGKLYYLHLGDSKASHVKFGKKGDYEDVTIINDLVVMLRSDGTLFSFPFSATRQPEATGVREWSGLLPSDEFEGLYGDPATNKLYVLCKHCGDEKASRAVTAYVLQVEADGSITQSGSHEINVKTIDELSGKKKIKFNPSALGRNPRTKQWYVVSSVNKLLVIADSSWAVKEVYNLDPSLFRQPEGIAFDRENNLYISNEGDKISKGNVLKFNYQKK